MKRLLSSLCAVGLSLLMLGSVQLQSMAQGLAPVAENLDLKTFRNVSLGGNLSAYDPEGGDLYYEITTQPRKGTLTLEPDGSFVYTPGTDKKGRDYFGYKAVDEQGNLSQEATAIIRIEKQRSPVRYEDMKDNPSAYAAAVLAEEGIYIGQQVGGRYCFQPDAKISRGEFIQMCMAMMGIPVLPGNLPVWEESLTTGEAAAILSETLQIQDVSYLSLEQSLSEQEAQACANLEACGILKQGSPLLETISREQAARMLCQAVLLLRQR